MNIVTRAAKGDLLTHGELDNNFIEIQNKINDIINTSKSEDSVVFSAKLSTLQTIPTWDWAVVSLDTAEVDTHNAFSNNRFQPKQSGYYLVHGTVQVTNQVATTACASALGKNGAMFAFGTVSSYSSAAVYQYSTASALVYMNGTTDYVNLMVNTSPGGKIGSGCRLTAARIANVVSLSIPYDIFATIDNKPFSNHIAKNFRACRPFNIPSNQIGSQAFFNIAPTNAMTFIISKNGSQIGTITFTAGSAIGTVTIPITIAVAIGDNIKITAPASIDSSASDFSCSILATLV